jgi:2-dehydropantoate 2-reductase
MKILVYGAGVIGSIFAGMLAKNNYPITVLARGKRLEEIQRDGIVLIHALTNQKSIVRVNAIDTLKADDMYDYIIIAVQNTQIDAILPILAENISKNLVFVVNNPLGYEKWIASVGKERIMIGFPSAGGERKNGSVYYFIGTGFARIFQSTTFGELSGNKTERLAKLIEIFKKSGFAPTTSNNMDAWQKTHVAVVVPIANALYQFDSNNYLLAKSSEAIKQMILSIRENFHILKTSGYKIEPRKLHYYYLPLFILTPLFKIIMRTKIAEYAMAKHTVAAKEEMEILHQQFLCIKQIKIEESEKITENRTLRQHG